MNAVESANYTKSERRANPRTRLQNLAYIHVEPDNGVIVLDVSNGGIRFCAATALGNTEVLRLQLSLRNNLRVPVTAKLVWMDATLKSGGLQFDDLPAGGLDRVVQDWLDYSGLPTHAGKAISPRSAPTTVVAPPVLNVPLTPAASTPGAKLQAALAAKAAEEARAPIPVEVPKLAEAPKPVETPSLVEAPVSFEALASSEAMPQQPLLEKQPVALLPPPALTAIPPIQEPRTVIAATNHAPLANDNVRTIDVTPQPPQKPKMSQKSQPPQKSLQTAALVQRPRPAPQSLQKIPAQRPIVARASVSPAKKTAPREYAGAGVAALLLIAALLSVPVFFRSQPASVPVASINAAEALAPSVATNPQPTATSNNTNPADQPAGAAALTAANPASPRTAPIAAPAIAKNVKAAPPDPASSANPSATNVKAGAAVDSANNSGPAGAYDLRGSVAAGFAAPVAVPLSGISSGPRNGVQLGGFSGMSVDAQPAASKANVPTAIVPAALQPAVILEKPSPLYTDEARKLAIEGEVMLDVIFSGAGQVQVLRVAKSLGHGLDESAVAAAQQIRFRPALQNGQAVDFPATLHITFQLAF